MQSLFEQINKDRIPSHIAIIMDGNGRWAEEKGQERLYGHYHAVASVRDIVESSSDLGVKYLTLYAFSTENWDRPAPEVNGLMDLLIDTVHKEVPLLLKNNVQLNMIGDFASLPEDAQAAIDSAVKKTEHCTGLKLIMALSYSSRWELLNAVKHIGQDVKNNKLDPEKIDRSIFEQYLSTRDYPNPDLMVRTGGEFRISNFLLYQLAYAELYFTETRWPDFRRENLYAAILDYQGRQRRFGKTGGQIEEISMHV